MAKNFVAICDPGHQLLRRITRHTPLRARAVAGAGLEIEYELRPEALPGDYFTLAIGHKPPGESSAEARLAHRPISALEKAVLLAQSNFFDAVCLDARCCRDLRLKLRRLGPQMVSAELLVFGVGVLRARNDDDADRLHHHLWSRYGRLECRHEIVHARIRALHWNSMLMLRRVQKEAFDSTNLIYGDALGEIEQLWDRRADMDFLNQVAARLKDLPRRGEIAAYLHPPLNLGGIIELHRRAQALWKSPPANGRALLRRIEYILDHTSIDFSPKTVFRWRDNEPAPRIESPPDTGARTWRRDSSGYDGWLRIK